MFYCTGLRSFFTVEGSYFLSVLTKVGTPVASSSSVRRNLSLLLFGQVKNCLIITGVYPTSPLKLKIPQRVDFVMI